jgi:DNA-binding NarL/FixJ family response regulator
MDVMVAWIEQTGAGDIASIFGLLVALVGFAITIRNVRASRAAAVRAEEAANEARRAIRFFDVVAEISTAIAAMEEIRRLHRDAAWPILLDRYNMLRKSLISIGRSGVALSDDQQTLLQAAIKFLADIERNVDRALEQGQPPERFARGNEATSEHLNPDFPDESNVW